MRPSFPIALFVLAVLAGACAPLEEDQGSRLTNEAIAADVMAAMDPAADPCRDFYRYACGGWLDSTELPPDRSRWARSFTEIQERNFTVLQEILDDAAANPGSDADRQKVGRFWSSCMDEEAVEAAGATPLAPFLEEIATVDGPDALFALAGRLQSRGVEALMGLGVLPDFKNPDLNIAWFSQGGLGLPDRDYYLADDPQRTQLREGYREHVARMLELIGSPPERAADEAGRILAFETELARVSRRRVEMRDMERIYNKLDIGGLKEISPEIPWDSFLEGTGYPGVEQINVTVPEFFEGLQRIVAATDMDTLQAYLRWQLVNATADTLSSEFVDQDFAFYGQALSGQQELRPRWKRCLRAVDGALGEALGRMYVERAFAGDSKEIALELIHGIEAAFAANLDGLAWMDPVTRERAAEKATALTNKIGYPDEWRDYGSLEVQPDDHFGNSLRAVEFEFHRQADKIGGPVDPKEWAMTPPTVNAYYNPLLNEMVFPAGILQPPFFHRDFPPALNIGGIGMGMAHELTHGFDDMGRRFDPSGEMTQWWEDEAIERFEAQTQCVIDLYNGFEVQDGLTINGELTLGENIADLGGIKEAWHAYRAAVGDQGPAPSVVEGLTNDQLFFVGNAQTWCNLMTPEMERRQVLEDPHSHPRFRAIGPASNLPAFAEVFSCEPGTPMNPPERCEVW